MIEKTIDKDIKERCEKYKFCTNPYLTAIQSATEQKSIDDEELGKALLYCTNKTAERVKREMIDKACKVIDDLMMTYISGKLGHDEVMEQCRIRMEE